MFNNYYMLQVEQTVTSEINKWENEHGRTFLVNGMSFLAYMKKTWKDFEEEKIREKEERVGYAPCVC